MKKDQITLLKSAFTRIAHERIAKWESLRDEGMVDRAKADAMTGFGMLCQAIEAVQAAEQEDAALDPAPRSDLSALPRYAHFCGMFEAPHGEYVRYSDVRQWLDAAPRAAQEPLHDDIDRIVEIAEQYEYRDPESGNVCFDRLGFARAIIAAQN